MGRQSKLDFSTVTQRARARVTDAQVGEAGDDELGVGGSQDKGKRRARPRLQNGARTGRVGEEGLEGDERRRMKAEKKKKGEGATGSEKKKKKKSEEAKGRTGVSSPTKQLLITSFNPDASSPATKTMAKDRERIKLDFTATSSSRQTTAKPGPSKRKGEEMEVGSDGEDLDSVPEQDEGVLERVDGTDGEGEESDDVRPQGRRFSSPRVAFDPSSSDELAIKSASKIKKKGKGKAEEKEGRKRVLEPKRPRPTSSTPSLDAEIAKSPSKRARVARKAKMEEAAKRRAPQTRGKTWLDSDDDEEEEEEDGYASASAYRRHFSQHIRGSIRPASDVSDPSSAPDQPPDEEEDEDDLSLSDAPVVTSRLRERKPDARGARFAGLKKARMDKLKKVDRVKDAKARGVVPDTDDDVGDGDGDEEVGEGSSPKRPVEIETSDDEEDEEDEEDDFVVEEAEGFETRRMVEDLMPQHFRGASRQTKVYHFKVTCQFLVHAILMPQINWRKASKDFAYSTDRLISHFDSTVSSLVSSAAWTAAFTKALNRRPDLSTTIIEQEPGCEACNNGSKISTYLLTFSGAAYDVDTMKDLDPPNSDRESTSSSSSSDSERGEWKDANFRCGRFCAERAQTYHGLKHWLYETHHAMLDSVRLHTTVRLQEDGKKRKKEMSAKKVERMKKEADRLTELIDKKGVVQDIWDQLREREKAAQTAYGGR